MHQLAACVGDRGLEIEALAEEDAVDLPLDPQTKRLEEHEDDDRRKDGVQVNGVEAPEVGDEHVEDAGQRETRAPSMTKRRPTIS